MTPLEGIWTVFKQLFWSLLQGAKTLLEIPIIRIPLIIAAIIISIFIVGKIIYKSIKKKARRIKLNIK